MEAIILAGGVGSRLRSVVSDVPKPMAPVNGQPFLELLLSSLLGKGISRVVLSVGYLGSVIQDYFGDSFRDIDLEYVFEASPLGTGGAVRLAFEKISGDHAFILNGDTFLDLDYVAVESLWNKVKRPIVVGRVVADTSRYGRILLDEWRPVGFSEKGLAGEGVINAGVYLFSKHQLDKYSIGMPFSLESDYLMTAVEKTQFQLFLTEGIFIDIGVPDDYQLAQSVLKRFERVE